MKKSVVYTLLITVLFSILNGCTTIKQNTSNMKPVQKNSIEKNEHLSANYFFLESRIHIKNKKFSKAVESLEKALIEDPDSFILTRDLISLYLSQGSEQKALKTAEKFVQKNSDHVEGLLLLVKLKQNSMEESKLVSVLNRILMLDPENKETFLRLGKIYMDRKNHTGALSLFKKMAEQFPDYYVSWFYLGESYLALKQYKPAKEQFLKTIELEPGLVQPWFRLVKIYRDIDSINKTDSSKKILELYRRIIEIDADNERAKLEMGLLFYKAGKKKNADTIFLELGKKAKLGSRLIMIAADEYLSDTRYHEAVTVFSQMLKFFPDNPSLIFFTAMAYEAVKELEKAVALYLKIPPDFSLYKKTILNISFLYKELGKDQTAFNYLKKKHEELPDDIDIIKYLASFYETEKKYTDAIKLLRKGLDKSPDNTALLFRLGAVLDKAGFKKECLDSMKKIIRIDPEDASALNYLGYTYADQGILLDKALELIKKANEIRPEDGYITDSLGWVYYKMGRYKKAVEILERAAELTSYETIISDHLGDAYLKTNQYKKALHAFIRALSNAKDDDKKLILELKEKIKLLQKRMNE